MVLGASGGEGLRQLCDLISRLPSDLPAAVLIVLHRMADRPSALRSVLARGAHMPVMIAGQGDVLQLGVCYIGEPGLHLSLEDGNTARLTLNHLYRNRTIDLLFQSAARTAGARTIGVILAGSLKDGAAGLAAIRRAGGATLVQTPGDGDASDMRRAAIAEVGEPDLVGSVEQVADAITRLTGCGSLGAPQGVGD